MKAEKPRVGDTIKNYTVSRVYERPTYWDCIVISRETGEIGYVRISKSD